VERYEDGQTNRANRTLTTSLLFINKSEELLMLTIIDCVR